jgi:prefoldin subunit 5
MQLIIHFLKTHVLTFTEKISIYEVKSFLAVQTNIDASLIEVSRDGKLLREIKEAEGEEKILNVGESQFLYLTSECVLRAVLRKIK